MYNLQASTEHKRPEETVALNTLVFKERDEYLNAKGLYSKGSVVTSGSKKLAEVANLGDELVSLKKGEFYGIVEPLDTVDEFERRIVDLDQLKVNYVSSKKLFKNKVNAGMRIQAAKNQELEHETAVKEIDYRPPVLSSVASESKEQKFTVDFGDKVFQIDLESVISPPFKKSKETLV